VLIPQLTEVRMMSKAWATKHNVLKPQDFKNKEETFATRNANGTGPYILRSREADVKTVAVLNSNWWGKREGNVDEIVYQPIKQDGTRLAALLSGEIDFVLDPPPQDIPRLKQDPKLKVVEGNENRVVFYGFDQYRDELQYSSVKGKNPFKDKRVREAIQLAIDVHAIKSQVMRGLSIPAGVMFAPQVDGYPKDLDKVVEGRPREVEEAARRCGLPAGFEITLDCPNNRYIADEKICVATAGMLAQVGIKVKVNAMPRANYFPKIQNLDTSFYMLGWGVPDVRLAIRAAEPAAHARGEDARWRLQPGALLQREGRRRDRQAEDRGRHEEARRARARDHQAAHGRRGPRAAAFPGDPVGDALQRERGAPRRQPPDGPVGQDQLT
jgi:peptide/nickel transport system substrate-binding protein